MFYWRFKYYLYYICLIRFFPLLLSPCHGHVMGTFPRIFLAIVTFARPTVIHDKAIKVQAYCQRQLVVILTYVSVCVCQSRVPCPVSRPPLRVLPCVSAIRESRARLLQN